MPRIFPANALTGGVGGCLDFLWPGDDLPAGMTPATGDLAEVRTVNGAYSYRYDATSNAAESSPNVIKPDSNAGNGRWLLINDTADINTIVSSGPLLHRMSNVVDSVTTVTVTLGGAITVGDWVEIHKKDTGGIIIVANGTDVIADSSPGGTIINNTAFDFGAIRLVCLAVGKWSINHLLGEWKTA